MSGGSFNYLHIRDVQELFDNEGNLQEMADKLASLGYADDAARETLEVLLTLRQFKIRIGTRARRLSGIWQAVEWWDSGDGG